MKIAFLFLLSLGLAAEGSAVLPAAQALLASDDAAPSTVTHAVLEKLDWKIESLKISQPTPMTEFLKRLGEGAGLKFDIRAGRKVMVQGKLDGMRNRDVLDLALPPRGLQWRCEGDTVIVEANFDILTYELGADAFARMKQLMLDHRMQEMLWPPNGEPGIEGAGISPTLTNGRRKSKDFSVFILRFVTIRHYLA